MIHEIHPHSFNNQYLPGKEIGEDDLVFHYEGNSMLLKPAGDEYEIPSRKDLSMLSEETDFIFLFTLDHHSCFLVTGAVEADEPRLVYRDLSFFRNSRRQEIAWASIAGFHLSTWYLQNRFCGRCGTPTEHKHDERAITCPRCNNIIYPRISPAVIVAITCNDKILLAHNSHIPGKWYSLLAGYVEVGESLEETLAREVKEEVGLDICNIRYYKSQPWPLSGSMMIGFIAEADDSQPLVIDHNEIADAAWFTRGALPDHALTISIAGEMIEKFERGEL